MPTESPDFMNIVQAARNIEAGRLPLYEHTISLNTMGKVLNADLSALQRDKKDKKEFFRQFCRFFQTMGYDTVSFEQCVTSILPGGGALGGHVKGVIQNRSDFNAYPWDELKSIYFREFAEDYEALGQAMPAGMKAIGGVGTGIFEVTQDLAGFEDLCYMEADDPELFADMFRKVGDTLVSIWTEFLPRFGDLFCVCRMGDDLGYKTNTMLRHEDISRHIIPQYKRIVSLIHSCGKPFLLHSCGCIFEVMDELINDVHIDAKHSNEDQILPFTGWVERYGDRIGNFGGIDVNDVCLKSEAEVKEIVKSILDATKGCGGIAFSTGNSIPDYVPVEKYVAMTEAVREWRSR